MKQKTYSCPNCGAPITGCRCEYCGTAFRISKEKKRTNDICEANPEFWLRELHISINPASLVNTPTMPTKISRW